MVYTVIRIGACALASGQPELRPERIERCPRIHENMEKEEQEQPQAETATSNKVRKQNSRRKKEEEMIDFAKLLPLGKWNKMAMI